MPKKKIAGIVAEMLSDWNTMKVRLGITAPRSVSVHRQEVYEQIQDQNRQAAQAQPSDKALLQGMWQKRSGGSGSKSR